MLLTSLKTLSKKSIVSRISRSMGHLAGVAVTIGVPMMAFSQPVQAQSATCQTVFLSNTLGNSNSFTNGQAILTLVRRSNVQGSPAYEAFVNSRISAGTFVTPVTLIPNQFALQFRLRTLFGRVQQAPVAVFCGPWRSF